jgi:predicted nucleotidyltransferase
MDLSRPADALVPSLDGAVLAVLARTTSPLTGREVARLSTWGSQSGVKAVLARLVRHGLVHVGRAGSSNQYLLNRDHVVAPAVLALVDLRGQLFARITETLRSWPRPPVAAAVFGSAARGDGDVESDIDLFLIRPARMGRAAVERWENDVADLARMVRRWSGNPAAIMDLTPGQVRDLAASGAPVVASLRRDAITLLGDGHVLDAGDRR